MLRPPTMCADRLLAMDDRDARQLFRGLPAGALRGRRLEYDPVSETLVLSITPERKGTPPQLYVRTPTRETSYVLVTKLLGGLVKVTKGYDVFVRSWLLRGSLLFCVVGEIADVEPYERSRPINDRGLVTIDLASRTCELWETARVGGDECFVTELVGSDGNGKEVYAVAGFPSKQRLGPVQYYVVRLSMRERALDRVFALEDIFF